MARACGAGFALAAGLAAAVAARDAPAPVPAPNTEAPSRIAAATGSFSSAAAADAFSAAAATGLAPAPAAAGVAPGAVAANASTAAPAGPAPDAAAASGLTPPATRRWRATLDAYVLGVPLAEIALTVERAGPGYVAQARIETVGLGWLFAPSEGRAAARGRVEGAAVAPAGFEAEGRFGREPQRVTMTYAGPGPAALTADPPLRLRSYDPAPETLAGALDPLNAAVAALAAPDGAAPCGRITPVFDSRRRFDLAMAPATPEGGLLRCEGRYVRVSGFKRKHMALPDHPFVTWWRVVDGRAEFVRAEAMTPYGPAALVRR
jgi:hypothetical protein